MVIFKSWDSLWPHGLQHARLFWPPLSPRVCWNSCQLSRWCYLSISSSAATFSFWVQSFLASGSFPICQLFVSCGQITGASTSASVLLMNIQGWFLEDWWVSSPCSPRSSRGSSPVLQFKSINFWCSAFLVVQLSHWYMTTAKTIALATRNFVAKVMSLLYNMLSRFILALLPRSKCLSIAWLQSPSAATLEPM